MPVNRRNVEVLKAAMRAHASRYNQDTYGTYRPECGTTMCLAGFCRVLEIGLRAFNRELKLEEAPYDYDVSTLCVESGRRFLRLARDCGSGDIFSSYSDWPEDLSEAYEQATTDRERVEVACRALDRLTVDGTIRDS